MVVNRNRISILFAARLMRCGRLQARMMSYSVPVVAALNGHAFAAVHFGVLNGVIPVKLMFLRRAASWLWHATIVS